MESGGSSARGDTSSDSASAAANGERSAKRQRTGQGGGGGGGGRGAGYSPPEISYFLSLLEQLLPVTRKEWKAIRRMHNAQFPSLKRTTNSLRRKFSSLCRSHASVDDPLCPPEVRRALHAKHRMRNRGDVPEDDDEPDTEDDENGEQDEDQQHAQTAHAEPPVNQPPPPSQAATLFQEKFMRRAPMPQQMPPPFMPNMPRGHVMHDRVPDAVDRRGMPTLGPTVEGDLVELIKMQLLQNLEDQRRRQSEERERREEERRHREEERAIREEYRRRWEEERARREEDLRRWEKEREETRQRHEEFMQLILSLLARNQAADNQRD